MSKKKVTAKKPVKKIARSPKSVPRAIKIAQNYKFEDSDSVSLGLASQYALAALDPFSPLTDDLNTCSGGRDDMSIYHTRVPGRSQVSVPAGRSLVVAVNPYANNSYDGSNNQSAYPNGCAWGHFVVTPVLTSANDAMSTINQSISAGGYRGDGLLQYQWVPSISSGYVGPDGGPAGNFLGGRLEMAFQAPPVGQLPLKVGVIDMNNSGSGQWYGNMINADSETLPVQGQDGTIINGTVGLNPLAYTGIRSRPYAGLYPYNTSDFVSGLSAVSLSLGSVGAGSGPSWVDIHDDPTTLFACFAAPGPQTTSGNPFVFPNISTLSTVSTGTKDLRQVLPYSVQSDLRDSGAMGIIVYNPNSTGSINVQMDFLAHYAFLPSTTGLEHIICKREIPRETPSWLRECRGWVMSYGFDDGFGKTSGTVSSRSLALKRMYQKFFDRVGPHLPRSLATYSDAHLTGPSAAASAITSRSVLGERVARRMGEKLQKDGPARPDDVHEKSSGDSRQSFGPPRRDTYYDAIQDLIGQLGDRAANFMTSEYVVPAASALAGAGTVAARQAYPAIRQ